ncbi:MAG: YncE family protein [Spirochaetota bacterium]
MAGLVFFGGCVTTGKMDAPLPPSSQRELVKTMPWQLTLQPGKNVRVYINGKKTTYTWISLDKSMRTMRLQVPLYRDRLGFDLDVKKKGYRDFSARVMLQGRESRYLDQPFFVALDPAGNQHRFLHYWKTGRQPKSVRFIDNQRVAVPLLNDTGIDIINIQTGKTTRIAPPEKFAAKEGFVESLVIGSKNELWISQMNTGALHVFDSKSLEYKKTVQTKGIWGKVLLYDQGRKRVYFSNWESKDISVIDADKYEELIRLPAKGVPRGMVLSEDGSYLYVCQYGRDNAVDCRGRMVKISLENNKIVSFFGTTGAKRHAVPLYKKGLLFVSDMSRDEVVPYRFDDERFLGAIGVYYHPNTIVLSPDRKMLYVSCRGKNNPKSYLLKGYDLGRIYVIDTVKLKVVEYWKGGNQPTGLDVSPDGRFVVFSDFLDDAIRVYRRPGASSP